MGRPERVANFSLRSGGLVVLVLVSDMDVRNSLQIYGLLLYKKAVLKPGPYNFRALRNDVTAKNTNKRATATAMPMSQRATSRVQARRAAFSQPNARTAKTAAMTS